MSDQIYCQQYAYWPNSSGFDISFTVKFCCCQINLWSGFPSRDSLIVAHNLVVAIFYLEAISSHRRQCLCAPFSQYKSFLNSKIYFLLLFEPKDKKIQQKTLTTSKTDKQAQLLLYNNKTYKLTTNSRHEQSIRENLTCFNHYLHICRRNY